MRCTASLGAAAAVLLCAMAQAQDTYTRYTSRTTLMCQSYVNSTSLQWCPTTTYSTTVQAVPFSVTLTTTPIVTYVPPALTATITRTRVVRILTVVPKATDIFTFVLTSTSSAYNITYTLITSTVTSTSTVALATATSTVYGPNGWLPILDTPNATYPSAGSSSSAPVAAMLKAKLAFKTPTKAKSTVKTTTTADGIATTTGVSNGTAIAITAGSASTAPTVVTTSTPTVRNNMRANIWPSNVICTKSVVVIPGITTIYPANTTLTRTVDPPVIFTVLYLTTTSTSYRTGNFDSSTTTTLTTTTTTTFSPVSTVITQTTLTAVATVSATPVTFYNVCSGDNILGPALPASYGNETGLILDDFTITDINLNLVTSAQNSTYDCCVFCLLDTSCAYGTYDTVARICYTTEQTDLMATPQSSEAGYYTENTPDQVPNPLQAFNGLNGYLYDGGVGY